MTPDRLAFRADRSWEHYEKYEKIAQALGIKLIQPFLAPHTPAKLRECYAKDRHLNNIPLAWWDTGHTLMSDLYRISEYRETGGWSLSNSVCTLKHVAIYHKTGSPPPSRSPHIACMEVAP